MSKNYLVQQPLTGHIDIVDDIANLRRNCERLQKLERKIEAFLSRISFDSAACLSIDSIMVLCTWGHPYTVFRECNIGETKKRFQFQTGGDAMRKAFELFEVGREGV